MRIRAEKTGGIWHGYIDGHPEVDERGLTEEIALKKAMIVAERIKEQISSRGKPEAAGRRRINGNTEER
jgi:predicted RNase H-like HicB family nuclease